MTDGTAPASGSRRARRRAAIAEMRSRDARRLRWLGAGVVALLGTSLAVGAAAAPGGPTLGADVGDVASVAAPDMLANLIPPIVAEGGEGAVVTVETVEAPLEPSAVTRSDRYVPVGYSRVVSTGRPGLQLVTYTVTSVGGVEVDRVALTTVVVQEPIDDVVAVGALVVPSRPPVVAGTNRAIGQKIAAEWGWTGVEWQCLDNLWERESNWRHLVANPSSGAYGIPQALPASKMASAGSDWETNPATQIRWGLGYIKGRYGTPCYAWGFWNDRYPHWY